MINTNEKKIDLKQSIDFIRILIYAAIAGLGAGVLGTLFTFSVNYVTQLRVNHPWLIYFLPIGGIVIVLLYKLAKYKDAGTDLVINSIHSEPHLDTYLVDLRDVKGQRYRLVVALVVLYQRHYV